MTGLGWFGGNFWYEDHRAGRSPAGIPSSPTWKEEPGFGWCRIKWENKWENLTVHAQTAIQFALWPGSPSLSPACHLQSRHPQFSLCKELTLPMEGPSPGKGQPVEGLLTSTAASSPVGPPYFAYHPYSAFAPEVSVLLPRTWQVQVSQAGPGKGRFGMWCPAPCFIISSVVLSSCRRTLPCWIYLYSRSLYSRSHRVSGWSKIRQMCLICCVT
jgi:hypothetical protein